jgi:hypothetical protein
MIFKVNFKKIFILFFMFLLTSALSAQYYDTGEDPASLKWMQIKTGRFNVIYPESFGAQGIEYARSLEEAYEALAPLFPGIKIKVPVIIHNYTTHSNGYVSWAPRRIELYPTPEQNTIPLSTEKQLAVHELTHVFQLKSLNRGFSKAMSLVLGEQFTGITASLLPLWFLEGQAVFAESALTESGRGRTPSFQKQLKSIAVEEGRMHKYDKILNGSFKEHVPDHYQHGYQTVTWAMAKYDPLIWNKVLRLTAEQPFTITPVSISLLKHAGHTKRKLFEETFDTLTSIWAKEIRENNTVSYEALNQKKRKRYTNYVSPVSAGKDSIIAVKTSLSKPPEFVLLNTSRKSEKKIHTPGQIYPYFISYGKGKLVWVETQSDPRWQNRNYSVIKILDIKRNKTKKLSRKSRYMAAAVSPDGKRVAAIENTEKNINNLVLIDPATKNILQKVPAPGNNSLQNPKWSAEGDEITFINLAEDGEGIISYNPAGREWKTLIEPGRDDLQSTALRNDSLFYVSSQSGTDNIWLKTPDGMITGVTNSRFGVIDISLNGRKLLFSDYSSRGNNICMTSLQDIPDNQVKSNPSSTLLINKFNIKPKSSFNSKVYNFSPEPYKKWKHLFNFHSWMPFYADLEEIQADPLSVRPGLSLMTQNQLSTLISTIGYEYSEEEKHVLHSRVTWKGWYPVFESQLDYGDDAGIYNIGARGESIPDPVEILSGLRLSNTISLPLRFSTGKFTKYLRTSFTSDYRNNYIYISENEIYDYGQNILSGRLFFSNYFRSALRDIYPKWAQTVDLNYSFAPFDKKVYGSALTLKTSFYFPGILPDNGIKIRYEKEIQDPVKFVYANRISMPRGYSNLFAEEVDLLSIDYVMPLLYPDLNISSLLFLKRIRAGLFYDYAMGPGNTFYEKTSRGLVQMYEHDDLKSFSSTGFELMADLHLFRIPYLISYGVQSAWTDVSEDPSFTFLFSVDLFGMIIGNRK